MYLFKQTGLKFKQPQLDTCHKCDLYHVTLKYETDVDKKEEILRLHKDHQNAADLSYQSKSDDKKKAKESKGKLIGLAVVLTYTFVACTIF